MAVLVIALAAAAITGLRETQDRIFALTAAREAGEAAAEAATAVIADAYAEEIGARVARPSREMSVVLGDASTRERARSAAQDMSHRNGGAAVDEVTVTCHAGPVDVGVSLGGTWFRARFAGPECSPR